MLRSAIVMLYAHWEGFVKEACQGYLDYVAVRRLTFDQLCVPLVETALLPLAARAPHDSEARRQLGELISGTGEVRARIPRQGIVDAQSNLRYEVLIKILSSLGLPSEPFETSATLIDRELCDLRNEIAHGRDNFPDPETVEQVFERVLELVETLRDLVLAAVSSSAYRREPTT